MRAIKGKTGMCNLCITCTIKVTLTIWSSPPQEKITPQTTRHSPILGDIGSAFLYYKSPKAKNNSLLAARSQHLGSLTPPEASE